MAKERQMLSRQACSAGLIPTRRPVVQANWLASLRSAIVTQICQFGRSFSTGDEEVCQAVGVWSQCESLLQGLDAPVGVRAVPAGEMHGGSSHA